MPEVEIDIDDLLEVNSEDERAVKLQVNPGVYQRECYNSINVKASDIIICLVFVRNRCQIATNPLM